MLNTVQNGSAHPYNPTSRTRSLLYLDKLGLGQRPGFHREITFKEWYRFGDTLARIRSSVQWAIGDWINTGEKLFGETYSQALDLFDVEYGTLRNWAWVSGVFPLSSRNDKLFWSHHRAVAVDCVPDEDRSMLLEMAQVRGMSSHALRDFVAENYGAARKWQNLADFEGHPKEALDFIQRAMADLSEAETVKISSKLFRPQKAKNKA